MEVPKVIRGEGEGGGVSHQLHKEEDGFQVPLPRRHMHGGGADRVSHVRITSQLYQFLYCSHLFGANKPNLGCALMIFPST